MKKFIIFISLFLTLYAGQAQRSKLRIAFVDMEMILDSMPDYKQALQELDARVLNWKAKLDKMQREINELRNELEAEKLMLTPDLLKEKEEIIRFKEEQMLKFQMEKFGPQGDYVLQKQMILKPVQDRVFNAVAKLVQLRHYDVVFDKSNQNAGIIHADSKLDITSQVIKILKKESKLWEKKKSKKKTTAKERYEEHKQQWKKNKEANEKTQTDTKKAKKRKKTVKELYEERRKQWQKEREAQKQNENNQ